MTLKDEAVLGELEGWVRQFPTFLFIPTCFGLQQSQRFLPPPLDLGVETSMKKTLVTGHQTSFADLICRVLRTFFCNVKFTCLPQSPDSGAGGQRTLKDTRQALVFPGSFVYQLLLTFDLHLVQYEGSKTTGLPPRRQCVEMGDTLWTKVTVSFSSAVTGHLSQAVRPLAADPSWFGERYEQGPSWWALPKKQQACQWRCNFRRQWLYSAHSRPWGLSWECEAWRALCRPRSVKTERC